jgi:hypothetical protein
MIVPSTEELRSISRHQVTSLPPSRSARLANRLCRGIAGSPLELSKSRVDIIADVGDGRSEKFTLLDLFHALNSKLKVLYERRYERDFQDVAWFFAKYPNDIRKMSDDLDEYGLGVWMDSLGADKKTRWSEIFDRLEQDRHGEIKQAKSCAT